MYRFLTRLARYSIFPDALRAPRQPGGSERLDEWGGNLASVLERMQRESSEWLPDVKAALSYVVPEITDLQVEEIGGYLVIRFKHEVEGEEPRWFEAGQESDGTLRLLGVLTALYQDPPPAMLAIQEPELFVHPRALAMLSEVIREASLRTQVVITTQSPELIAHFTTDEIRVVERVKGGTKIGPIAERQREVIEKRLFDAGELILIEGLERASASGER